MSLLRISLGLAFLLPSTMAFAQGDLGVLIDPQPEKAAIRLQQDLHVFSTEDIKDTGESLGLTEYELDLRVPVWHAEGQVLFAGASVYGLDLDTDGLLAPGIALPSDLYDVSAGLGYLRELDRGWTVAGTLRVGSASDELFDSSDEIYLQGTGLLRIPDGRNAWILAFHADTRHDWPVYPGVGYQWQFESGRYLVLGLPFLVAGGPITDRLRFETSYFPIDNVRAALRYEATENITPYLTFAWNSHYFVRAGRDDDDDRLEFEDKRIAAGVAFDLGEHVRFDIEAGYAFDRWFGEGDDRSDRDDDSIDLDDAGYLGGSLRLAF
ncbi:MAG: hypothetical protein ACLFTT_13640 [Candidatus Hydrogenedentota bacterium]